MELNFIRMYTDEEDWFSNLEFVGFVTSWLRVFDKTITVRMNSLDFDASDETIFKSLWHTVDLWPTFEKAFHADEYPSSVCIMLHQWCSIIDPYQITKIDN